MGECVLCVEKINNDRNSNGLHKSAAGAGSDEMFGTAESGFRCAVAYKL
jgi:hypothetical protein